MASKRSLAQRLFKISTQTLANCRISSPTALRTRASRHRSEPSIDPDPGDRSVFRRFLHKRAIFSAELLRSPPTGESSLMEKLKLLDIARDRIRIAGMMPLPSPPPAPTPSAAAAAERMELTAEDARKLVRVAQLEVVKSRLTEVRESWISYPELVRICGEACSDPEQGSHLAKALDESGNVVVLGKMVLLRTELVAKAMVDIIPSPGATPDDPRLKELEELKKQKLQIDRKADALVRRELWLGLGFLVAQTAGFMRLTFWELSWDVMEPICFYVTSMYFMAGYAFFLRTSREPSFEGFFQSRFAAKQKKLMKMCNFDARRYDELRRVCFPHSLQPPSLPPTTPTSLTFGSCDGMPFDSLHD